MPWLFSFQTVYYALYYLIMKSCWQFWSIEKVGEASLKTFSADFMLGLPLVKILLQQKHQDNMKINVYRGSFYTGEACQLAVFVGLSKARLAKL